MRVLYYSSDRDIGEKERLIFTSLHNLGVATISNLSISINGATHEAVLRKAEDDGASLISKIDGLIIEGPQSGSDVRFLVASALSQAKPVLLLIQPGQKIDEAIDVFKRDSKSGKVIYVKIYSPSTVNTTVKSFVSKLEKEPIAEKPTIKFTLRITSRIDRYLTWKAKGKATTKADLLRKIVLEEVIAKDKDYVDKDQEK